LGAGQIEEAEAAAEQWTLQDPSSPRGGNTLAEIYLMQGKIAKAVALLLKIAYQFHGNPVTEKLLRQAKSDQKVFSFVLPLALYVYLPAGLPTLLSLLAIGVVAMAINDGRSDKPSIQEILGQIAFL